MKTIEEEMAKLKREHQQFSDALEYLERSLPNGIQIVAAALANVPRDECPALVALEKLKVDCARAELRARELVACCEEIDKAVSVCVSMDWSGGARNRHLHPAAQQVRVALAASPDSDERLREVMTRLAEDVVAECGKDPDDAAWIAKRVNEVLVVKS